MKSNILVLAVVSLVTASIVASAAFNYAQLSGRTFQAAIVSDANAYLALETSDADYACYVSFTEAGKSGEIDIVFDGGTGCSGSGTGVNPDADTWFYDMLTITNKGNKALNKVWLNSSLATMLVGLESSSGSMRHDSTTFAQAVEISNLAVGSSYYIGFHVDTTGLQDSGDASVQATLSVEAKV